MEIIRPETLNGCPYKIKAPNGNGDQVNLYVTINDAGGRPRCTPAGASRPSTIRPAALSPRSRARAEGYVYLRRVFTELPKAETVEAIEALLPGDINRDQISAG